MYVLYHKPEALCYDRVYVEGLLNSITHLGWIAVVLVLFAESGLLVGFFLPGDSLLFVTGTLLQQGVFHINIFVILPILFAASALGNSLGYYLGKKYGRSLFTKKKSRILREDYLRQAEEFYNKYGQLAVLLAMFVPIVRAFAAFVAGLANMPYKKFLPYNLAGVGLWVTSFTLLGYAAGDVIKRLGINVELAALIIIAISLLPLVIHVLYQKRQNASIIYRIKKLLRLLK